MGNYNPFAIFNLIEQEEEEKKRNHKRIIISFEILKSLIKFARFLGGGRTLTKNPKEVKNS